MSAYVAPRLFPMEQTATTSDDYYTPAWVFRRLGLRYDLDVASPPGGLPWVPADRYFTQEDDGLVKSWVGRVWMNPPYSDCTPWVERFIDHGHGVALLPMAKSWWLNSIFEVAHGIVISDMGGEMLFQRPELKKPLRIWFPVFFAAFGDECVEAISHLGAVRTLAPPVSPPPAA